MNAPFLAWQIHTGCPRLPLLLLLKHYGQELFLWKRSVSNYLGTSITRYWKYLILCKVYRNQHGITHLMYVKFCSKHTLDVEGYSKVLLHVKCFQKKEAEIIAHFSLALWIANDSICLMVDTEKKKRKKLPNHMGESRSSWYTITWSLMLQVSFIATLKNSYNNLLWLNTKHCDHFKKKLWYAPLRWAL